MSTFFLVCILLYILAHDQNFFLCHVVLGIFLVIIIQLDYLTQSDSLFDGVP